MEKWGPIGYIFVAVVLLISLLRWVEARKLQGQLQAAEAQNDNALVAPMRGIVKRKQIQAVGGLGLAVVLGILVAVGAL